MGHRDFKEAGGAADRLKPDSSVGTGVEIWICSGPLGYK